MSVQEVFARPLQGHNEESEAKVEHCAIIYDQDKADNVDDTSTLRIVASSWPGGVTFASSLPSTRQCGYVTGSAYAGRAVPCLPD